MSNGQRPNRNERKCTMTKLSDQLPPEPPKRGAEIVAYIESRLPVTVQLQPGINAYAEIATLPDLLEVVRLGASIGGHRTEGHRTLTYLALTLDELVTSDAANVHAAAEIERLSTVTDEMVEMVAQIIRQAWVQIHNANWLVMDVFRQMARAALTAALASARGDGTAP